MSRRRDAWYVLLPSGQEIKAKSTASVMRHLESGAIPKASRARRSRDDEWTLLEWHAEFTEAVTGIARPKVSDQESSESPAPMSAAPAIKHSEPLSGIATRLDPMMLRTVGVRGITDDLIAALDSTFAPGKLLVAAFAAGLIGLVWGGVPWLFDHLVGLASIEVGATAAPWLDRFITLGTSLFAVVVLALANALLTRMTHLELSTMRRSGIGPALKGIVGPGMRLAIAYLLILGGVFLAMSIGRWIPEFLYRQLEATELNPRVASVVPAVISIVALVVEVLLWLLVGLTWLLAPILVGEDFPLFSGIGEWLSLIRSQFNRIVLAQTLTLAVGALVALPFVVPVYYALSNYPLLPLPVQRLAMGLSVAGFLAFVAVANVFTYLDVKYEHSES